MILKKKFRLVLTILVFSMTAATSQASVFVPAGLQPGDMYHLAFVTAGARDATSTMIGDYNVFVRSQAAMNSALTGTDMGVMYNAIASTSDDIARVNALVAAPVYLLDGTKIADGFDDMWDGDIDANFQVDQYAMAYGGRAAFKSF